MTNTDRKVRVSLHLCGDNAKDLAGFIAHCSLIPDTIIQFEVKGFHNEVTAMRRVLEGFSTKIGKNSTLYYALEFEIDPMNKEQMERLNNLLVYYKL
jgi:hypothetical protein